MRLILITFVFLMFTLACFADDWYTIDGGRGKSSAAKALRVNFYYF